MMEKMVRYCRARGTATMVGEVLRDNCRDCRMREFTAGLGFEEHNIVDEPDAVRVTLDLKAAPTSDTTEATA